jgi:formate--tetrahydrofolate ligase
MTAPSDLEIARAARLLPIGAVAERLGVPDEALHSHGRHVAKLDLGYLAGLEARPEGRLVLVTAISPTPAGEGKTTTTVGLGDGLNRIGRRAVVCLREPSLGPCFGMKGGAAGGGRAQVAPMERINLHFTGDFHAIGSAHNLLAALLDNHVYWGNALGIDQRRVVWRRALDMNDRALRQIVSGSAAPATASRARTASTSRSPRRSWRSSASPATLPTWRPGSAASSWPTRATGGR